ncbi:MAG: ABC transporter permease, partial [Sphingomonas bacterium]|nr:ABC transporter permease [Sphingomonas bacterium]
DSAIARRVADALPSVTMIRVGDVIGQIGAVLSQVAIAIRVAALVTVAAGIVVLIGAIAAAERTRRYDAVVLKLLGATARQVLAAQAIEYLLLSIILAIVALIVGGVAGWYVVIGVFDLGFAPDWRVVTMTLTVALVATLGIGVFGSLPALRARPAETLRAS